MDEKLIGVEEATELLRRIPHAIYRLVARRIIPFLLLFAILFLLAIYRQPIGEFIGRITGIYVRFRNSEIRIETERSNQQHKQIEQKIVTDHGVEHAGRDS